MVDTTKAEKSRKYKEWYNKNKQWKADYWQKWYKKNKDKRKIYKLKRRKEKILEILVQEAKLRAEKRNIEFNIKPDDIFMPKKCPLLGIEMVVGKRNIENSPSLDRIDNSKGYIKDNVWVISLLANRMKSTATNEQLKTFSRNVLSIL